MVKVKEIYFYLIINHLISLRSTVLNILFLRILYRFFQNVGHKHSELDITRLQLANGNTPWNAKQSYKNKTTHFVKLSARGRTFKLLSLLKRARPEQFSVLVDWRSAGILSNASQFCNRPVYKCCLHSI